MRPIFKNESLISQPNVNLDETILCAGKRQIWEPGFSILVHDLLAAEIEILFLKLKM